MTKLGSNAVFVGAKMGLVVILLGSFLSFSVVWFSEVERRAPHVEPKLTSWSNERVLGELGEAAQVTDCEALGGPGLVARFFVSQDPLRLTIVCTPAQ